MNETSMNVISKVTMIEIVEYTSSKRCEKLEKILSRSVTIPLEVEVTVKTILEEVRTRGDAAILEFTKEFDGVELTIDRIKVSSSEMEEAYQATDPELLDALHEASDNIRRFHEREKANSWFVEDGDGVILGKRVLPIEKVGIYVPNGLISSLLMSVIPAKVAGVLQISLVTPPDKDGKINPFMLAAAKIVGVQNIYKIGGAQAIAALSFGTETVPKVDKIVGPGNQFVITAKKLVFGTVGIEMLPGPSEILVIASADANPAYVAADLLSQAEHGTGYEAAICVTDSSDFAKRLHEEVSKQVNDLTDSKSVRRVLENYGAIFIAENIEAAIALANEIAPEHLELVVENPWELLNQVRNAGAIFLGPFSPEPVGDFFCGTNHILPTNGTARFASSLSVSDFMKTTSIVAYSAKRLAKTGKKIVKMAEAEELEAHAKSVRVRMH